MNVAYDQLPNPAILLAPSHMHGNLRMKLLEETNGAMGIAIQTIQAFLQRYQASEVEELEILLQYRELLSSYSAHVYHTILHSLDFMKQCHTMINDLKLYGILPDQLSEQTEAQREMKAILTCLYPIITEQDLENEAFRLLQGRSLEHVVIVDAVWSMQDQTRIERLLQLGAKRLRHPKKQPVITYYHSINKRKEVEVAAQLILKEQRVASDLHIVVCDPSYQPLIKQIFDRYHIPFTMMKQVRTSSLTKRVQALLQYALKADRQTLLKLINVNTFDIPYLQDFCTYMEVFDKQLDDSFDHVHRLAAPSELISEDEIKRLKRLEEHAQGVKEQLLPSLQRLMHTTEPKELLQVVNELATASIRKTESSAGTVLRSIQEIFVNYVPQMKDGQDIPFLLELLEDVKETASSTTIKGAMITQLSAPLLPNKACIVFGCTQKLYPAFPAKKGLFDEAYVRTLPDYPFMKERSARYQSQLERALFAYEELIVSYPIATYDGKTNEGALEMEQLLQQQSHYREPIEAYEPIAMSYTIDQDRMKRLFLKDQRLYGSISAYETYIKCPFSYFLSYGLKLKEPIDHHFSTSRIGTLSHYILETLVKTYGKSYTEVPAEEIQSLIHTELCAMALIYPFFQKQIPLVEQRMMHAFMKNLAYLKEMEEHSHLSPSSCEEEFWWELSIKDDLTLCLHGFIDRLDSSNGYQRIIDYKSSHKALAEADVRSGLQLQLITYALYAKKTWQKEVLGAFYYSLKQENISIGAGKMRRRPVEYVPLGKVDYEAQISSSKRLTGWTFHKDIDLIDDDGTHILGVRQNKDGLIKARKAYDLERLEALFLDMYQEIATQILLGQIDCSPTEDACLFCPYASICRFHGYTRKAQPIIDGSPAIEQGGE